ncbi:MAG: hypothetical protein Kow0029_13530 [Candidatus Rifleibacteriota bacterium]
MVNLRSRVGNFYVLIALMLLLPVVSAFAVNNTFNFRVIDEQGVPAVNATVYVWDKNDPSNNVSGVTSLGGEVQLVLPGLVGTADSLTNPAPNVGFAAFPDNGGNATGYAHAVGDMVFYNLFNADAIAPAKTITVKPGCLVHIKPQINDGTATTPGLVSGMRVFIPGVPWQVKDIVINPTQINASYPTFDIFWPHNSYLSVDVYGDGSWSDWTKPTFYTWENKGIQVGNEETLDFDVVHNIQKKAAFRVNIVGENFATPYRRHLSWGNQPGQQIEYNADSNGNADVYLPKGFYNFNFSLINAGPSYADLGQHGPVPAIWNNVDLNDETTPAVRDYTISGGVALTVRLQLGTDAASGDESILGSSRIEILKKVNTLGFDQWSPIMDTPGTLSSAGTVDNTQATMVFFHRLGNGFYKIRVFDDNGNKGVIDNLGAAPKSFAYVTTPEFEITGAETQSDRTEIVQLPQTAAILAPITILNAPANGAANVPVVAYQGESALYEGSSWHWYSNNVFIPFARVDKPVLVRLDYDGDITDNASPISFKLWQLPLGTPGQTIIASLTMDYNAFTDVSVSLMVGNGGSSYQGTAKMAMSPCVPGTDVPGQKAMGSYYGFQEKIFDSNDQNPMIFRAEIGSKFSLDVQENYPMGLEGFMPYHQIVQIPADHDPSNPFQHDAVVLQDPSFAGVIKVDDNLIPLDANVGVTVSSIIDSNFNEARFYNFFRSGVVTGPNFKVSGITAGRYNVELNLDNVNLWGDVFNQQNNPVINRQVNVTETSTALQVPIVFNLNTSLVGYVQGKIVDDKGAGVAGLHVAIHHRGQSMNDYGYSFYNQGPPAFLCTTNAEGSLIRADGNTLIPLEAGDYDLFIRGIDVEPTDFKYSFMGMMSMHEGSPVVQFSVRPNNQVTPILGKVTRTFPLTGVISENSSPVPFQNFQVLSMVGEPLDYGYTNENGEYELSNGVPAGPIQLALIVEDGPNRRFYLKQYNVIADQANTFNVNLDPNTLLPIKLLTKDSTGVTLPYASGDLFMFSNPTENFRAQHWWLTWIESDDLGNINLFVPAFTPEQEGFAYGFQAHEKWDTVVVPDPANPTDSSKDKYVYQTYAPPPLTMLPLNQTEPVVLTWKKPAHVKIDVTNVPAERAPRYIGVLMSEKIFREGLPNTDYMAVQTPGMPGEQQPERPLFAPLIGGSFNFNNVATGKKYVFAVYESFDPIFPEDLEWAYDFTWRAIFRHVSMPFDVSSDLNRTEALAQLGDLTVTCSQDPTLVTDTSSVKMQFTANPLNTTGGFGWPVIMNNDPADWVNSPDSLPPIMFPIKVPVNYALRIAYVPESGSKYLPRVYESVVVPTTGKTLDLVLKELKSISGAFTRNGAPVNGQIILIPEGANANAEDFEPIRIDAFEGTYQAFLPPGFYTGYAVPMIGAPKLLDIVMEPETDLTYDIDIPLGQPVFGRVVGPNNMPIFDASVAVMRKETPQSELMDGQPLLPYPVVMGDNEVRCGPDGRFFFEVEDGVDYYIQAIVPVGFNPGSPQKVSVNGTLLNEVIINVGEGGKIIGSVNVPAMIEAQPSGQNAIMEQFSMKSMIRAEAMVANADGRFEFSLYGLDPAVPYDITVYPMEPGKAVKVLKNVPVPQDPAANPLNIDLGAGFKVVGQLLDVNGNPLNVEGVPVNLAMTLPMETLPAPTTTANLKFAVRQNTTVPDPADYSLREAILRGQWTETNKYGQFEFNNVPQFLVAFIKTDSGFVYENVDYGIARTDNFVPAFETSNVMEVSLTVPVAGKISGRLIDETGQPVKFGSVDAMMGQSWGFANVQSDGTFVVEGLAPGANYMLNITEVPGHVDVFRMGILVEEGKTTDVGPITVARAVPVTGTIKNLASAIGASFQYGISEKEGLSLVSFDGNHLVTDEELADGSFFKYIYGDEKVLFDPFNPPDGDVPFLMFAKFGKAHIGMVHHREDENGVRTLVTWGWQPGLAIPSIEQLGTGTFELGAAIVCPNAFGNIEGTLKHSTLTTAKFNPDNAMIALYAVDANGNKVVSPFPTAVTNPVDGRWFIDGVPAGTYRIKVVTKEFGSQFFTKIITIGDTLVKEDLALSTKTRKVFGKVVVSGGTTPVASAKVSMYLRNLATQTDANGEFAFYLPVGDFLIAQLEVGKPGFETKRVLEFAGIATSGIYLENDLDLGTIELSNNVGRFEATVLSSDGNKPLVGAEVAMVFKESPSATVWTIGEIKTTDESGLVQFDTVPVGKDVTFRARAFYHKPKIYTLTAANNTGVVVDTITLEKANPKVFYTGIVSPIQGDDTQLNLKAIFDFNEPVYQSRLGLEIAGVDRLSDANPVDLIGGRLTSMRFDNSIPKADEVIATVSYNTANDGTKVGIGSFNLVGGALYAKVFDVDPLQEFTARQTDENGNPLPTGLSVPPGYLDPTIETFNIVVASETPGDSVLEGSNTPPEFAGPSFEFTFGGSNFSAGTSQQGLFEITIQYDEGTSIEPRWYDATNKRWSTVGIVKDSIKYDSPSKGYVTFKVSHLTKFAVLKNVSGAASGLRCDFTGDGVINDQDLAGLIARNQLKNAGVADDQITAANISSVAAGLLTSQTFTISVVPSVSIDDLNGDGNLDDNDLAFLIGWMQLKNAGVSSSSITESAVKTVSSGLLGSLSGSLAKFPGEIVTR